MSLLVKLVEGLATLYGASLGRVFPHRVILCYHNVGTPGMPRRGWLDDARLIDTRDFAAQIDWLQRHCELLSLDDLLAARTARKTQVAITFDDGYYNNLSEVLPIMRERKAPMTWFVATAFVDEPGRLPWWDLLDLVTARDNLKLTLREAGVAGDYDLSRAADRTHLTLLKDP